MAREIFKNLPDTSTPINARKLNGLFNGEEAMGSIVVDDISCKNKFNISNVIWGKYAVFGGTIIETGDFTNAFIGYVYDIASSEVISISAKSTTTFRFSYVFLDSSNNPISGEYISGAKTTHLFEGMIVPNGATKLLISQLDAPKGSNIEVQVEKGSIATEYTPYSNLKGRTDIITGQECPTNEYIDGNRVYVKRITFDTSTLNYVSVADNVKDLIDARMFVKQKGQRIYRPIPWLFNSTDSSWYGGFMATIDDNNKMYINTQIGSSLGDADLVEVTIKYTKLSTSSASMMYSPSPATENETTSLEDEVI